MGAEDEACNHALPPQHARLCKEGLECIGDPNMLGGGGTCHKKSGPFYVEEDEACNHALPPQHARLCKEGLECIGDSNLIGGGGTCQKTSELLETSGPFFVE